MHYEVNYEGDNSPRRAVLDWCQWLGFRRAKLLAGAIRKGISFEHFEYFCAFAGVSGYPVRAAFEHFGGAK